MIFSLLNRFYPDKRQELAQRAIDIYTCEGLDCRKKTPFEKKHGVFPVLQPGDIVLFRHKKGHLRRKLLRLLTDSYWDHAAMIIFPQNPLDGHSEDVLLELKNDTLTRTHYFGSSMHKLTKYSMHPELYDIGIKRVSWLTEKDRERIRSYAIAYLDEPYYPFFRWSFIRAIYNTEVKKDLLRNNRFACSALIQKAYFYGISPEKQEQVMFKKNDKLNQQVLELVSPADIADSLQCDWIYRAR